MKHSIKTESLQKVLNYLQSRPWVEVDVLLKEVLANIELLPKEEAKLEIPKLPEIPPPRL